MPKKSPFAQGADYEVASKLPKEMAVRNIINTSVNDGKMSLKNSKDTTVIEECIRREEALEKPGATILKALKAKLKKLQPQEALDIKVDEVTTPDLWQPARDYYSLAQRLAKASVACQVMLGFELTNLKKKFGYTQGRKSAQKKKAHDALFSTFEEHVKAELGISKDTARRFIGMSEAVKRRLKSCYNNLPLLEKPITEYSDDELKILDKAVELATDGETQKSLLIEWKIAKKPQGSAAKGGDLKSDDEGSEDEELTDDEAAEQLAFAFITPAISKIAEIRLNKDYEHFLHAMPVIGDEELQKPGLVEIKAQLESMVSEIDEVIESRKEAALATTNQ